MRTGFPAQGIRTFAFCLALCAIVASAYASGPTDADGWQPWPASAPKTAPVDALNDVTISVMVRRLLSEDRFLAGTDVHVSTLDGVVTLHGRVSDLALRDHATRVIQAAFGVRRVDNHLAARAEIS